ncbi:hypothetical protein TDB9533_00472 [Thalassocella blandensis]|nr:hypothetical protein TDB9533_00472 [Thalassocella blandensis]
MNPGQVNPYKRMHEPYAIAGLFAAIGPVIWGLHYVLVYFVQRALCNGYGQSASQFVATIIALATAIMCIFLVAMILHAPRLNKLFKKAKKSKVKKPSKTVGRLLNAGIRILLALCIIGMIKNSTSLVYVSECGVLFSQFQ